MGAHSKRKRGFSGWLVAFFHGLWQESFGGDPDVLGRSMTLDGVPYTIVGVLPQGWRHPGARSGMDILLPLQEEEGWSRYSHYLRGLGRMAPDVTLEQAQNDFSAVAASLDSEFPDSNEGWGVSMSALEEILTRQARPQLSCYWAAWVWSS